MPEYVRGTCLHAYFRSLVLTHPDVSGDEPARSIWETHSDALSMILQARGTSSQCTSPVCGRICRGAHRVIVRVFLIYILKMMISNLGASCSRIYSSEKLPARKVRCEKKV
jgi:hypothetical protein